MNCFRQAISCFSSTFERFYNPPMTDEELEELLSIENTSWKKPKKHIESLWSDAQTHKDISKPLYPIVEKALVALENHNIHKGIAVDLGCGISPTVFQLLSRGWKVYAVDNIHVLSELSSQLPYVNKWLDKNQLILLSQNIESFELPEKVHLVIATDSLPYCNPEKIKTIFSKMKNALLPNGLVICNLYSNSYKTKQIYKLFTPWIANKSIVNAILRQARFPSFEVVESESAQYHIKAS